MASPSGERHVTALDPPPPHKLRALSRNLPLLLLLLATACTRPTFPDYAPGAHEFAYIANRAANTVTVLDLVYLRPDRTLSVGLAPSALAVSPTRDEVYVVNAQPDAAGGSLSILDTARNAVVATIPLHRNPTALSVDPAGHRAFLANTGANTVSVVDLDTRRLLASYPTGEKPSAALISPDGRTLVVTNRASGSISLFTVAPHPAPPLTLRATLRDCPGATSPVILPDSSKAFIACADSNHVLAVALAVTPDSWPARQDASLLTDHALALLDVGQTPAHLTLKPDGGEVFVANFISDSVSEISTQTNEVGSTYPIGNHPTHGVVSADNSALWVSNSGADSISLYSILDGKLVSSLRTGNAPDALTFSHDEQMLLAADSHSGDIAIIRTASRLGPALLTLLPAGAAPTAIVTKFMPPRT